MAVRPLVTTGVALASAGAIIAATPGLITPPNIAIAAASSASAAVAPKKPVSVKELKLLSLSQIDPQLMLDIFFRTNSWGGIVGGGSDAYYGGDNYGYYELLVQTGTDEGKPVYSYALDEDGYALYAYVDEDGVPSAGTDPIYVVDAEGNLVQVNGEGQNPVYESGDPIPGDSYRDGFVGLAYYLSDQILDEAIITGIPLLSDAASFVYNNVNPYFYEAGVEETVRVVLSELTGGPDGLVGQALATVDDVSHNWLTYTGMIATLAASGVPLAGPDLAAVTNIFFFGGVDVMDLGLNFSKEYNQGIDGVINYVVDRVLGTVLPGSETDSGTEEATATLASAKVTDTQDEEGPASPKLPDLGKLLSLKTPNIESPFAKLAEKLEQAPAEANLLKALDADKGAVEDKVTVEDTGTVDDKGTGTITPVADVEAPEAPEVEAPKAPEANAPKAPEFKLPELKLPERKVETTEAEADKAEADKPETDKPETDAAAKPATGSGRSLVRNGFVATPGGFTGTERKKTNGEKFVEKAAADLKKAFTPKPKQDTKPGGQTSTGDKGGSSSSSDSGGSDK